MADLTRMSDGQRRGLQVGGILLVVVGLLLFVSFPLRMMSFGANGGTSAGSAFALAAVGMILLAVGSQMARFGFLKPVSEIVATETGGAVEHAGQRAGAGLGRGFAQSGMGTTGAPPREVVKIKCRGCGYLESEDARFCSGCGQAV